MSYRHLSMQERNVVYRMKWLGKSKAETAGCLGRSRSTISRELRRNVQFDGRYVPGVAEIKARLRRRAHLGRPKTGHGALMRYVEAHLRRHWSPEQIAGRLHEVPPRELGGVRLSHTTIYRWIWADAGRAGQLKGFLRVAYKPRRKPYGKPSKRGQIPGRVSIEERPKVVAGRQRIGDWEGDTVVGKGRSGYVATCVDRASRYLVARKLHRCTARQTNAALHDGMRRLPAEKRQTLTTDNGREFARHRRLGKLLGLQVYFAHPYSSWERGTNENTNGLLRQYLPKKTDFSVLTDWQLASYVWQLNNRPRKCLNYRTPAEVFHERPVALTM
jgi:IS30 family transposase